jgi:hypothetical protein
MSQQQTVIYAARTLQDAHLLKNLLQQFEIEAAVLNDLLERGSGVGVVGWPTSARVVVAEEDAPRAREIALEFDRQLGSTAAGPTDEGPQAEEPAAAPEPWPTCPGCGARRSTRCPICGTAGSDFQAADMGFVWIPGLADAAAEAPSCTCGPGGCTPVREQAEIPAVEEDEAESPARLLVCPTCDEPFTPQYPRLCEWCGHDFGDGYEVELPQEPEEQINARVIAAIVGLLAFVAAMVVYLTFIVR